MNLHRLTGHRFTDFHDSLVREAPGPGRLETPRFGPGEGLWHWVERNHLCNILLWDEEDIARRTDVPDAEIVRCKRSIDRYNQQRNDAVEAIDACLLAALHEADARPADGARVHSETPGAMLDRLSILSLKIHHMGRQALRRDAGAAHALACSGKLERLMLQRDDLRDCLDQLLFELVSGTACFRQYRQFKMYNDPALNPWLSGQAGQAGRAGRPAGAQPTAP